MKELGPLELLRYALSGGIAMAVLFLTFPAFACSVKGMDATKEATLILSSVLLIGTLIYNLHRALLFPFFLRYVGFIAYRKFGFIAHRKFSRKFGFIAQGKFSLSEFLKPWQPSELELKADRWRWNQPRAQRKRWDEWGAQTHSLYCAAWAILTALLLGKYVWGVPDCRAWLIFWVLFGLTLLAGTVNNYRLIYSIAGEMGHTPASSPE